MLKNIDRARFKAKTAQKSKFEYMRKETGL